MEIQKNNKIPLKICSYREPSINSSLQQQNVFNIGVMIMFQPLVEFDILGNTIYYGVRKYSLIEEIEKDKGIVKSSHSDSNRKNVSESVLHIQSLRDSNDKDIFEIQSLCDDTSAYFQIVINSPVSLDAQCFTEINASENLTITINSHPEPPTIMWGDLQSPLEKAIFKKGLEKFGNSFRIIENKINDKYNIIIEKISDKKIPLEIVTNE